jgi:hypothetical protein
MSKLAISAIASVILSCLMAGSAFASPLAGVSNNLKLNAAWSCGCKQSCGCEKKCGCKQKCCKPKCSESCCPKKKKCCPAVPEYPEVCSHAHGDMERDLSSRQHAG